MSTSKEIRAVIVAVDGLTIRTIRLGSFEHIEYADRLKAARHEGTLQLQRWQASDQFVGRKLSLLEA